MWDVAGQEFSRTDIAGAEPELPSTVRQAVHCTTDRDAIHAE